MQRKRNKLIIIAIFTIGNLILSSFSYTNYKEKNALRQIALRHKTDCEEFVQNLELAVVLFQNSENNNSTPSLKNDSIHVKHISAIKYSFYNKLSEGDQEIIDRYEALIGSWDVLEYSETDIDLITNDLINLRDKYKTDLSLIENEIQRAEISVKRLNVIMFTSMIFWMIGGILFFIIRRTKPNTR